MNSKSVVITVVAAIIAMSVTRIILNIGIREGVTRGRLSACSDITSALNSSVPGLELACTVIEKEVYISTPLQPGRFVSLDGKTIR